MFARCNKHSRQPVLKSGSSKVAVWGEDTIHEVDSKEITKGRYEAAKEKRKKMDKMRARWSWAASLVASFFLLLLYILRAVLKLVFSILKAIF